MRPRPFSSWISRASATGAERGIVFMVLATLCAGVIAPSVRTVSAELHPFQIAFFGSVFGVLAFAPYLWRHGVAPLRTRRFGLLALRGALGVLDILLIFTAFKLTPLAKVVALEMSSPLLATVLALVILGETIRVRRIAALVLGFMGMLVIVRPGLIELDLGTACALLAALSSGSASIVIKVLSRTEASATISLYTLLLAVPFNLIAAIPVWKTPSWEALVLLALIGAATSLNHIFKAQAFKETELTVVLPLNFLRMIWIPLAAFIFFGEVPVVWTWVGAVMIFSAATYTAYGASRRVPRT